MKIFEWMNQKLHWSAKDYSLMSCKPKPEADEVERDTEALLLGDMLDGFLTIGTLGLGHPVFLPSVQEEEEDDPQPAAAAAADADVEEGLTAALAATALADQRKPPAAFKPIEDPAMQIVVVAVLEDSSRPSIEIQPLLKEGSDIPRTTLADLFAADAVAAPHACRPSVQPRQCCMTKCSMMKVKDSSPPQPPATGKKLQRLMRMLKRKRIHPVLAKGTSDPQVAGEDNCLLHSKA